MSAVLPDAIKKKQVRDMDKKSSMKRLAAIKLKRKFEADNATS